MRTSNVKDFAIGLGVHDRGINAFDSIADIGKTAGLQSVAVDWNLTVVQYSIDENRLRSTPPTQVVAWAIRPKEAQHRDRESKALLVGKC